MCGFVFSSSAQTSKAFKQSFDHIFHRDRIIKPLFMRMMPLGASIVYPLWI